MEFNDVPELVKDYLTYMRVIKGNSDKTIKEYYYDLRRLFRFLAAFKNGLKIDFIDTVNIISLDENFIKSINLMDLYEYMNYLINNSVNKANSRARKIASIKSFFNYLTNKKKILNTNPAKDLETPNLGKRVPKYLNLDESKKLLSCINGKHKERDFAIITLFLNCGLRLSELVNINLHNISSDTLRVVGKGNKERTIYLNNACLSSISNYLKVRPKNTIIDRDALFLSERKKRISNRTVEILVKNYIIQAGLDPKKYSPHKLRHTAATLLYKHANVDIRTLQQILGHESISTTEIYTHIDNDQLRDAIKNNPLNNM